MKKKYDFSNSLKLGDIPSIAEAYAKLKEDYDELPDWLKDEHEFVSELDKVEKVCKDCVKTISELRKVFKEECDDVRDRYELTIKHVCFVFYEKQHTYNKYDVYRCHSWKFVNDHYYLYDCKGNEINIFRLNDNDEVKITLLK